jgi:hypothetical protein
MVEEMSEHRYGIIQRTLCIPVTILTTMTQLPCHRKNEISKSSVFEYKHLLAGKKF